MENEGDKIERDGSPGVDRHGEIGSSRSKKT